LENDQTCYAKPNGFLSHIFGIKVGIKVSSVEDFEKSTSEVL